MKGWMGGKRRHMALRRRDPIARQREFLARRRELARQSVPRDQKAGGWMNTESRSGRPPRPTASHLPQAPQAPRDAPSRVKGDPRKPFEYSNDFALVGDASELESIVPELRNARKRIRDHAAREERESKRRSVNNTERPVDAFSSSYPSQDIRIFDADDEKTPLFRRRTLPHTFLNSENTTGHRTSKYFAKEADSRPKRLKNTAAPDLSSRLSRLKFSPPRRIGRIREVTNDASHKSREVSRRFPHVEQHPSLPASPSQHFDEINRASTDNLRPVRTPQGGFESSERSTDAVRNGFDGEARRFIPESPEQLRTYPIRWKGVDTESHSRSPVFSTKHIDDGRSPRSTRMESRFPLIEAESDSPPLLSPARKKAQGTVIGFRSLLASEPICADDFSAEVLALEAKMFGSPDSGGRRFTRRGKLLRQEDRSGSFVEGDSCAKRETIGRTSNAEVDREAMFGEKDLKDARVGVRNREEKSTKHGSTAAKHEQSSHNAVDVTVIRTEQNPIRAAIGKKTCQ